MITATICAYVAELDLTLYRRQIFFPCGSHKGHSDIRQESLPLDDVATV